jgi:hypothetical protein
MTFCNKGAGDRVKVLQMACSCGGSLRAADASRKPAVTSTRGLSTVNLLKEQVKGNYTFVQVIHWS